MNRDKSKQTNPSVRLDSRYIPLILNSVNHGIFTVNEKGQITSFNRAAENITGYSEAEALGQYCKEIFQTDICNTICPLRTSITTRKEIQNKEVVFHSKSGQAVSISVTTTPLLTSDETLLGGVEVFRDITQIKALERQLDEKYRFDDIISKNAEMQRIFTLLPLVANSISTILITGESGTGKELIAKAIHNSGLRKSAPFVAINCAAMPEHLIESELFGYKKGAFTDAKKDKPGRIQRAEGGTLFLDEVADLAKSLQVKILRFLAEHTYEPLGSTQTRNADVRIIAATNRDLHQLVQEKEFREDLFFRLNVMEINLPPLRKRAEDIPLLVQHFIRSFSAISGRTITDISSKALSLMMRYTFPGNIRELENMIERAFIVCEDSLIREADLPDKMRHHALSSDLPENVAAKKLAHAESQTIIHVLKKHNGNRTKAAKELGIHRVTLIRKLKKLGIQ